MEAHIARRLFVAAGLFAAAGTAWAADEAETADILVYGRALAQIGSAVSGSQGTVGYRDFEDKPLGRVGELVENVPGMIATQHSGTGKANQYFLRGFNLDHGTDFAGFVDGVPINMRTHGHGQGYLDLNFLIPELVERIDYRKGPYFADTGDFSAAGTVGFRTADRLVRPIVQATAGSFGYYRALAAGSGRVGSGDLLLALDGTLSNGPWVLDEDLRKVNGLVKLSQGTADHGWSLGLTGYHASWNATDQVPERAIDSGLISRFGNIDPDLGGRTTRLGLVGNATLGATTLHLYATYYRFLLTSDFTYFLDDPVNGDEFQQRDRRGVFGGSARHDVAMTLAGLPVTITLGSDARWDHIGKIGLYRSIAGRMSDTVREDKVDEYSGALYAEATASITDTLRLTLGLRGDVYGYDVDARTLPANSGKGTDAMLSPKAAIAWRAGRHFELYANYGESFHSNDVRGASIRIDPASGEPAERVDVLVKARGAELGARLEFPRLTASLVGYHLTLGSELVFVGDGGTTEPNDATSRYGAEATLFWRPRDWLTLDASAALTHARFRGVAPGEDRIPNSVSNVVAGGATAELGHGLSASLRLRHFGAAPLIEDDSARSRPTALVNLGAYYRRGRLKIGADLLNLFDARDADISYLYASRLRGEPDEGVADRHIHPVEPRQLRVSLRYAL
ncbi:TonB-dependent receptor [Sphingomonas quercus]|uniref:TonB-dependent receptor n=1 Tax=Sphingomonas quercus TaxID=2842451 RepID=A0ABS6BHN1_9SPHN|nr:TonB-dependent receptor [Sphingomonas quercus]MBU3076764.1 TonB-dependent receptor [Sphingomonas quercus]